MSDILATLKEELRNSNIAPTDRYVIPDIDKLLGASHAVDRDPYQPKSKCYVCVATGMRGAGKTNAIVSGIVNGIFPFDRLYVIAKHLEQPKIQLLQKVCQDVELLKLQAVQKSM